MRSNLHGLVAAAAAIPEKEADVANQHEAWQDGDGGEDAAFAGSLHGFQSLGLIRWQSFDLGLIQRRRDAEDAGFGFTFDHLMQRAVFS